jgi:site-specific recombinase XerD
MFFKWLTRQYHLLFNPASELELPRTEQRLPRHVLNVAEVEQVINAIDIEEPTGLGSAIGDARSPVLDRDAARGAGGVAHR